uniref:Retrotransposon protein, putative, unclassified n=1 Tax=Oryza sativa subsp. japonica TaxID=39947 RepID=Q2QR79_ORYSJ|nr:retrotransposon protein, putative, unclassified [Oryza sativa Japonica Group]
MVTAGDHRRGGAAPERAERRGKANGGLRLTPGQRRRRERRPEWRKAAARLGMTMATALRRDGTSLSRIPPKSTIRPGLKHRFLIPFMSPLSWQCGAHASTCRISITFPKGLIRNYGYKDLKENNNKAWHNHKWDVDHCMQSCL